MTGLICEQSRMRNLSLANLDAHHQSIPCAEVSKCSTPLFMLCLAFEFVNMSQFWTAHSTSQRFSVEHHWGGAIAYISRIPLLLMLRSSIAALCPSPGSGRMTSLRLLCAFIVVELSKQAK